MSLRTKSSITYLLLKIHLLNFTNIFLKDVVILGPNNKRLIYILAIFKVYCVPLIRQQVSFKNYDANVTVRHLNKLGDRTRATRVKEYRRKHYFFLIEN